jgi:signal transduction histidine kinase
MRLTEFITQEKEKIIDEWVSFAETLLPSAEGMSVERLRDSGPALLGAIVRQMEGRLAAGGQSADAHADDVAETSGDHALGRLKGGFDLGQVISEYRALRMSVLRLWAERQDIVDAEGVRVFNEAIDEALAEAAERYTERIHEVKDQFVGVLGHDLGTPLSAIIMAGRSLLEKGSVDEKARRRLARIVTSAERMHRMIRDVLDLTRQRFHRPMPLNSQPTDLGVICRDIVAEVREANPERFIRGDEQGDLRGQWDADRMAEVVSNLVSNAIQHGAAGSPVEISLAGDDEEVVLAVKNQGEPIPEEDMAALLEPFQSASSEPDVGGHLGLGLFITREIVAAHGGRIEARSSAEAGTTFTVHMPRHAPLA